MDGGIPGDDGCWTGVGGNYWSLPLLASPRWAAPGYKLEGHRPILLLNGHRDNSARHKSPWWGLGGFNRDPRFNSVGWDIAVI